MNQVQRLFSISAWGLRAKLAFGLLTAIVIELALVAVSLAIVSQALPAAMRPVVGGQLAVALLVVLLPGLALISLAWALIRIYVVSPIERLCEGLKRLAGGGYDRPLPVPPIPDEIGQATSQLNTINDQFRQAIRDLESTVAQRTRDLEAAREIGLALSPIRDIQLLAERVTTLITERFENVYYAQLFLLDDSGSSAILQAGTGEQGQRLLARGYRIDADDPGTVGQALRRGTPLLASDVTQEPETDSASTFPDTRARCVLPFRAGSMVLGVLDLHSRLSDAFSEVELRLFQTIADQLSSTIQNVQLFEELQMRVNEFEALNRQTVAKTWRDYALGLHTDTSLLASNREALSPLQRHAIQTGNFAELRDGDRIRFAVPIRLRGQPLGAIEWEVPRATYNESVRTLAEELTARLALTADNIRLIEQSQRQAQRERLLNEIGGALTQQTDIAQILETAVQQLGQALNVSQTVVQLRKENSA